MLMMMVVVSNGGDHVRDVFANVLVFGDGVHSGVVDEQLGLGVEFVERSAGWSWSAT